MLSDLTHYKCVVINPKGKKERLEDATVPQKQQWGALSRRRAALSKTLKISERNLSPQPTLTTRRSPRNPESKTPKPTTTMKSSKRYNNQHQRPSSLVVSSTSSNPPMGSSFLLSNENPSKVLLLFITLRLVVQQNPILKKK